MSAVIASDALTRFAFEHMPVRGAIVQLGPAWQTILQRNTEGGPAGWMLGEACAAAALMFSNIKLRGRISLQLQGGDGAVQLLLAQCDSEGQLRAVLRADEETPTEGLDFAAMTRGSTLAITIEKQAPSQRYQGIVPLDGDDLGSALEGYFTQSEQLPTRLWLRADEHVASGLLLQRLPGEADDSDGWNRALQLAETISSEELRALSAPEILHRLYHEEDVRLFDAQPLRFGCSCTRERVVNVLRSLGEEEIEAAAETDGSLEVACEFCNERYGFDAIDLKQLFSRYSVDNTPQTPQ